MNALERVHRLIALSGSPSDEEGRSAAFQACKMNREHGFNVAGDSIFDVDSLTDAQFRGLEHRVWQRRMRLLEDEGKRIQEERLQEEAEAKADGVRAYCAHDGKRFSAWVTDRSEVVITSRKTLTSRVYEVVGRDIEAAVIKAVIDLRNQVA